MFGSSKTTSISSRSRNRFRDSEKPELWKSERKKPYCKVSQLETNDVVVMIIHGLYEYHSVEAVDALPSSAANHETNVRGVTVQERAKQMCLQFIGHNSRDGDVDHELGWTSAWTEHEDHDGETESSLGARAHRSLSALRRLFLDLYHLPTLHYC
jgi:hypothetical protein